jgi:hypothetical protein
MAKVGNQPVSPHGKAYYSLIAFFALLFGAVFTWGVLHSSNESMASRLFGAGLAIVCLLGGLQALERLLRPEQANRRSRAFSESARLKIHLACHVIRIAGTVGLFCGPFLHLLGMKDFGTDLGELGGLLLFVGGCLADLIGRRLFQPIGT